jgi:hypothetical protein
MVLGDFRGAGRGQRVTLPVSAGPGGFFPEFYFETHGIAQPARFD